MPSILAAKGGCPKGMVRIPGGTYAIGADTWWRKWATKREQKQVEEFCIDQYEYPNIEGELPRVNVSFQEAKDLCEKAGKRLCRQEEWLAACQGKEGRYYSYGAKKDIHKCNTDGQLLRGSQEILPSGTFPECASPEGVRDLDGNVSEWVVGGGEKGENTLAGGTAWYTDWYGQDCTSRHWHTGDFKGMFDDGLRCCK